MTTEDDIQAMLDANPEDHTTRLVLADFLQDRDDPRAEGIRVYCAMQLYPDHYQPHGSASGKEVWCWWRGGGG